MKVINFPIKHEKVDDDATEEGKVAEKFEVRGYPNWRFFKNGKPSEYGGYLKVALNLDNIPFGITGDEAVCTEYGLKAEGVITVKIFDDGKALLTKGVSALT